jgi:FMN phosphatase YigB (HAD superfamily)
VLLGGLLSVEEIARDLAHGDDLRKKHRASSTDYLELSHEQLWGELVAAEWPAVARATALVNAAELSSLWARRPSWRLRPGIADLLDYTIGVSLPVAVVSNTRSGQAHREMLDEAGLTGALAAQIYSDELGVFKPHPGMIWAAARELGVPASSCWFVGDRPSKDIECGRRAGVAAAILMPSGEVEASDVQPDAVVADGNELLKLLRGEVA